MARNYIQGIYEIQNWDKYCGTKNPRYLSSYELAFFKFCDRSPAILKWGAEIVIVKYHNPVKNRQARYIVDVYIKYVSTTGIKEQLIEIKPSSQCRRPVKTKRKSAKTFKEEMDTWAVNTAKWSAASKYAEERGLEFKIVTEQSLM